MAIRFVINNSVIFLFIIIFETVFSNTNFEQILNILQKNPAPSPITKRFINTFIQYGNDFEWIENLNLNNNILSKRSSNYCNVNPNGDLFNGENSDQEFIDTKKNSVESFQKQNVEKHNLLQRKDSIISKTDSEINKLMQFKPNSIFDYNKKAEENIIKRHYSPENVPSSTTRAEIIKVRDNVFKLHPKVVKGSLIIFSDNDQLEDDENNQSENRNNEIEIPNFAIPSNNLHKISEAMDMEYKDNPNEENSQREITSTIVINISIETPNFNQLNPTTETTTIAQTTIKQNTTHSTTNPPTKSTTIEHTTKNETTTEKNIKNPHMNLNSQLEHTVHNKTKGTTCNTPSLHPLEENSHTKTTTPTTTKTTTTTPTKLTTPIPTTHKIHVPHNKTSHAHGKNTSHHHTEALKAHGKASSHTIHDVTEDNICSKISLPPLEDNIHPKTTTHKIHSSHSKTSHTHGKNSSHHKTEHNKKIHKSKNDHVNTHTHHKPQKLLNQNNNTTTFQNMTTNTLIMENISTECPYNITNTTKIEKGVKKFEITESAESAVIPFDIFNDEDDKNSIQMMAEIPSDKVEENIETYTEISNDPENDLSETISTKSSTHSTESSKVTRLTKETLPPEPKTISKIVDNPTSENTPKYSPLVIILSNNGKLEEKKGVKVVIKKDTKKENKSFNFDPDPPVNNMIHGKSKLQENPNNNLVVDKNLQQTILQNMFNDNANQNSKKEIDFLVEPSKLITSSKHARNNKEEKETILKKRTENADTYLSNDYNIASTNHYVSDRSAKKFKNSLYISNENDDENDFIDLDNGYMVDNLDSESTSVRNIVEENEKEAEKIRPTKDDKNDDIKYFNEAYNDNNILPETFQENIETNFNNINNDNENYFHKRTLSEVDYDYVDNSPTNKVARNLKKLKKIFGIGKENHTKSEEHFEDKTPKNESITDLKETQIKITPLNLQNPSNGNPNQVYNYFDENTKSPFNSIQPENLYQQQSRDLISILKENSEKHNQKRTEENFIDNDFYTPSILKYEAQNRIYPPYFSNIKNNYPESLKSDNVVNHMQEILQQEKQLLQEQHKQELQNKQNLEEHINHLENEINKVQEINTTPYIKLYPEKMENQLNEMNMLQKNQLLKLENEKLQEENTALQHHNIENQILSAYPNSELTHTKDLRQDFQFKLPEAAITSKYGTKISCVILPISSPSPYEYHQSIVNKEGLPETNFNKKQKKGNHPFKLWQHKRLRAVEEGTNNLLTTELDYMEDEMTTSNSKNEEGEQVDKANEDIKELEFNSEDANKIIHPKDLVEQFLVENKFFDDCTSPSKRSRRIKKSLRHGLKKYKLHAKDRAFMQSSIYPESTELMPFKTNDYLNSSDVIITSNDYGNIDFGNTETISTTETTSSTETPSTTKATSTTRATKDNTSKASNSNDITSKATTKEAPAKAAKTKELITESEMVTPKVKSAMIENTTPEDVSFKDLYKSLKYKISNKFKKLKEKTKHTNKQQYSHKDKKMHYGAKKEKQENYQQRLTRKLVRRSVENQVLRGKVAADIVCEIFGEVKKREDMHEVIGRGLEKVYALESGHTETTSRDIMQMIEGIIRGIISNLDKLIENERLKKECPPIDNDLVAFLNEMVKNQKDPEGRIGEILKEIPTNYHPENANLCTIASNTHQPCTEVKTEKAVLPIKSNESYNKEIKNLLPSKQELLSECNGLMKNKTFHLLGKRSLHKYKSPEFGNSVEQTIQEITRKKRKIRKLMYMFQQIPEKDQERYNEILHYLHSQNKILNRVHRQLKTSKRKKDLKISDHKRNKRHIDKFEQLTDIMPIENITKRIEKITAILKNNSEEKKTTITSKKNNINSY